MTPTRAADHTPPPTKQDLELLGPVFGGFNPIKNVDVSFSDLLFKKTRL